MSCRRLQVSSTVLHYNLKGCLQGTLLFSDSRLSDPQTPRPADLQTRRPVDPQTRRPVDPQTRRPADPLTLGPKQYIFKCSRKFSFFPEFSQKLPDHVSRN
jgi:hypothetical protein